MSTSLHIATVDALRERIRCLEGGARPQRAVLPFGIKAIDERLQKAAWRSRRCMKWRAAATVRSMVQPLRSSPPGSRRGPGPSIVVHQLNALGFEPQMFAELVNQGLVT